MRKMTEPAPVRPRLASLISPRRLALTVAAPPLAWSAQGLLGWYIAARACQLGNLSTIGVRLLLLAVSVLALAITVVALLTARHDLRRLADSAAGTPLQESAEFLSSAGFLIATALAVGIVWAGLPAFLVHVCGEMR